MTEPRPLYKLSPDRRTLAIARRTPAGIHTTTVHRDKGEGPFADADVDTALAWAPPSMQAGQRNRTRRKVTRFGVLWTHVMLGPPTWWLPKVKREDDGTVMAGWLRAAIGVRFDRSGNAIDD